MDGRLAKALRGDFVHVVSAENGGVYLELWRNGENNLYYLSTGASLAPAPLPLQKGPRLDRALDRFFGLLLSQKGSLRKRLKKSKEAPCTPCAYSALVKAVHDIKALLKGEGWERLPEGWDKESVKQYWTSLTRRNVKKWGFTECVERMSGHVDNPEAFCASAHKEALGRWPAEDPKE
jgi:hypothetical protein